MGGARGARARTLAARGRHRYGGVRAGIDGADPGELRRRRTSRPGGRVILGARLRPHAAAARVRCRRHRSRRGRARTIRRWLRRRLVRGSRGAELSVRACVRWSAPGPDRCRGAETRSRRRRRRVSGRRLPIGRPRASRPRSGDLAPRRRRGCSVTSCRPRAHAAIACGRHGDGAGQNRKGGR